MRRKLITGKMIGAFAVLLVLFMSVGVAEEILCAGHYAYVLKDGLATIVGHIDSEYGWKYWFDDRPDTWPPSLLVEDESAGFDLDADEEGATANYKLVIPERLDGYPVVAIGVASGTVVDEGAFEHGGYTDVTIPEGITSIGNSAFADCHYIEALTIPQSVTYIAEDAFEGWYGGTTLRVVEGSYAAQYAEKNEFPYTYDTEYKVFNSGEWQYTLANGTATICGYEGADSDLIIPDYLDEYPVTAIGYGSWLQWRLLTDNLVSVTIPDGITSIDARLFVDCYFLTRIDVSPNNPVYEDVDGVLFDKQRKMLVYYPSAREGAFTIPGGVTGISENAFYDSMGLTSVIIPDSVASIGEYAFFGCKSLSGATIPDGVTSIGDRAFSVCWGLTGATIPASVAKIGINPFANCRSLTTIDVSLNNLMYEGIDGVLFDKQRQTLVSYPGARNGDYTIPDGVTSIGEAAFPGCTGLTGVAIPNTVTSIGEEAFYGCTGLASVSIPDSVTSIGDWAFYECESLTSVAIPASITFIGENAFSQCEKLTMTVTKGSYAEQYAIENKIPYEFVDG